MMKLELTGGHEALIDEEDFPLTQPWKWRAKQAKTGAIYAYRQRPRHDGGRRGTIFLHKVIAGTPEGMFTDHINGNTLDNRRANLRVCDKRQNCANRVAPTRNCSGFKGVNWIPKLKKYVVRVGGRETRKILGYTTDLLEAARLYNQGAIEMYGQFASLNKVD